METDCVYKTKLSFESPSSMSYTIQPLNQPQGKYTAVGEEWRPEEDPVAEKKVS